MAVVALIVGSIGLFVAVFLAWYSMWHRRARAAFEKVPVGSGRSAYVLRKGVALRGRRT